MIDWLTRWEADLLICTDWIGIKNIICPEKINFLAIINVKMVPTAFCLKVQDDLAAEDMVIIVKKEITKMNLRCKVDFGCSNYYLVNY